MKTEIILTGILKDNNKYLIVKRDSNDDLYPGTWEFPGGHLEDNELLKDGLKRELYEEIGFDEEFVPVIINYYDEIKNNIHTIEIDFLINVDSSKINIKLSNEHEDYKWVLKDSNYMDNYIKSKLININ